MKFAYFYLCISSLFLLIGCEKNENSIICGNCDAHISVEELKYLKEMALKGDLDSANKVAQYYLVWGNSKNIAEKLKWTEVAALLGSSSAQYNLGTMLVYEPGDNCQKAIYWLTKSSLSGNDLAKQFLVSKTVKQKCQN